MRTRQTRTRITLLLIAAAGGTVTTARAGNPTDQPPGRLVKRTYVSRIDGANVDYALWLPAGYHENRVLPLIVFLHGSGEGTDWKAPTRPKSSVPVLAERSDLPFLVAFPLMRGSWSINALAERDVLDTIADVQHHYPVDPERVHLVGLSLGGFAGWRVACRYPHLFASLTAICGGGEPGLAINLRQVAVRVYHGAKDPVVPVQHSREMIAALRQAEIPVEYTEVPRGGHNIWQEPLGSHVLYDWIAQQRRPEAPRRISYRTHSLRHNRAHWATIETMLEPSQPAYLDVFVPPGENQIFVHVENIGRVLLDVPGQVLAEDGPPVFVVDGKDVPASRTERGWRVTIPGVSLAEASKRHRLSGPLLDVLNDPFVVSVASSASGQPDPTWFAAASQALSWTNKLVYNGIRPLAAHRVTDDMIADAHLICFGNPENHAVLQRVADRLPLVGRGDRVLFDGQPLPEAISAVVSIHPNPLAPDRYLVVCSGNATDAGSLAALALTPPYLAPEPIEDLLVMRNDQPLRWEDVHLRPARAAGTRPDTHRARYGPVFDAHWQLTPDVRSWLLAVDETDP